MLQRNLAITTLSLTCNLGLHRALKAENRKNAPAADVKTFQTVAALEQHLQPLVGRINIQRQVLQPYLYQYHQSTPTNKEH